MVGLTQQKKGVTDTMLIELAASATLGGLGTVVLSHWLSAAKGKLHDFSVDITCPQLSSSIHHEVIAQDLYRKRGKDFCFPSEKLIDILERHDYLPSPDKVYRHYQEYTSYLYTNVNESAKLKSELERTQAAIEASYNLYMNGRFKEAFIELSKTEAKWWEPILGEFKRLNFNLDDVQVEEAESISEFAHPLVMVPRKQDGEVKYVPFVKLGKRNLGFPFNDNETKDAIEFAQKVAIIFATEDRAGLERVFDFLKSHTWVPEYFDKAAEMLEQELQQYSRVVFKGAIANVGRYALSVQGVGKMIINCKGNDYVNADGKSVKVENDIELDCHVVDDTEVRALDALSINGGNMNPVTIVSSKRVNQTKDPALLLAMFYNSRVNIEVSLPATENKVVSCTALFRPER